MTIDQKLNRLIELVEKIHEFNSYNKQPAVKLQALQGTRPQ